MNIIVFITFDLFVLVGKYVTVRVVFVRSAISKETYSGNYSGLSLAATRSPTTVSVIPDVTAFTLEKLFFRRRNTSFYQSCSSINL